MRIENKQANLGKKRRNWQIFFKQKRKRPQEIEDERGIFMKLEETNTVSEI